MRTLAIAFAIAFTIAFVLTVCLALGIAHAGMAQHEPRGGAQIWAQSAEKRPALPN